MGKDLKGKELGVGLNQRKDGRYQARFTTKNGKRKEKNFEKISDARDWLSKEKYLNGLINGNNNITVNEWYEHWIKNYKENIVRIGTLKAYKTRYENNIKNEIGDMSLCDVKNIDCQEIINKMFYSSKYSYGTIRATATTLHSLFKYAVENKYIQNNPASNLKIKKNNSENIEPRVFTKSEQKIFIECSKNSRYYNIYILILETGLRVGEVCGLKWDDIDFKNKCLYVKRTLRQDKGLGIYYNEPKTLSSKRKIPLTNKAIEILKNQKKYLDDLKYGNYKWSYKWEDHVFLTIYGNPVTSKHFERHLKKIENKINKMYPSMYFKHFTMHTLRHSFATRCIENGVQPKILQKVLGHSSLQTTMDLYVHATDEQMFKEFEKMNL